MAKNKKAFILYNDQKDIFNELTDEYAGKLIKHIFKYVTDQNPITDDLLLRISFASIKSQLKRDLEKYELESKLRSESGRLGGIKSGEARRIKTEQIEANEASALKSKQTKQNEHDTDTDKETDKKERVFLEKKEKGNKEEKEKKEKSGYERFLDNDVKRVDLLQKPNLGISVKS
jgi:hypothetical protein